jgi:aromatic-L-amino-acid/L-tryptophan decarboxylase
MGALDPLEELGELCARERLWFHVDAAWGGAAVLSDNLRHLLAGAEAADSIVLDPHKWLSMPMGTGVFLTRHHALMQAAFRIDAPYAAVQPERDFYTTSMQWSRRFTGLRLFMALAIDGREATAARLDHQAALADLLRRKLRDAGWSIDNDSPFPVVCFHDEGHRETAAAIAARVNSRGRAWLADTKVPSGGSASALRACVTSYRAGPADIEVLVDELEQARRSLRDANGADGPDGADARGGRAREGDRA